MALAGGGMRTWARQSEGAQGSSGLLRPPAQVVWRPGERRRSPSSGALRRDDREDAREL